MAISKSENNKQFESLLERLTCFSQVVSDMILLSQYFAEFEVLSKKIQAINSFYIRDTINAYLLCSDIPSTAMIRSNLQTVRRLEIAHYFNPEVSITSAKQNVFQNLVLVRMPSEEDKDYFKLKKTTPKIEEIINKSDIGLLQMLNAYCLPTEIIGRDPIEKIISKFLKQVPLIDFDKRDKIANEQKFVFYCLDKLLLRISIWSNNLPMVIADYYPFLQEHYIQLSKILIPYLAQRQDLKINPLGPISNCLTEFDFALKDLTTKFPEMESHRKVAEQKVHSYQNLEDMLDGLKTRLRQQESHLQELPQAISELFNKADWSALANSALCNQLLEVISLVQNMVGQQLMLLSRITKTINMEYISFFKQTQQMASKIAETTSTKPLKQPIPRDSPIITQNTNMPNSNTEGGVGPESIAVNKL